MESAFRQLIEKTQDLVVACGDWPSVKKIIGPDPNKAVSYGLAKDNLWQAYDIDLTAGQANFKVKKEETEIEQFSLKLFGEHNVLNALACIIVALKVGIDLEKIRFALQSFNGAERRFQISEKNGIIFVDDYGHHPSEIKATLKAVRQRYPAPKIYCVFQPHTASRTRALLADFAQSFAAADKVLVTDIFTSAREKADLIKAQDLVQAISQNHPAVVYSGNLDQTTNYLRPLLEPGIVIVTMGAGDVYQVRDKLIE